MALINKIREKTGLAVGLVALGLILFLVGGDLLGPRSVILGKNKNEVGEIAGETISRDQYVQQIEQLKYNFTLNYGRNPTESDMINIRQQAWEYLIVKIAFQKQYDKVGLKVTEDEVVDMVQGKNIHPDLVQAFTNPETGEFNRDQIVSFLQNLNQLPQQQQAGWYLFESNLRPSRLRIKYDNLLVKTNYATDAEAEEQYKAANNIAEVKYLYVPYYTISDTLVEVSDQDLENYLQEHRNQYKLEESRDINYVRFPIIPSTDDTLFTKNEIEDLAKDFNEVDDDSVFARINTDGDFPYKGYHIGDLPLRLRSQYNELHKGEIIGPYLQSGSYIVNKISDITTDTVYYARASHILIRPASESVADRNKARAKAQDLLNQLRNGANFAMLARNNSDDPSSSSGGDLGWFDENRMVQPFSEAVFSVKREGLIPRLIETQYGFHIINVTGAPTNKLFKVATIERDIIASDATRNEAFRKADYFLSISGNREEFERNAAKDSLTINEATEIGKNDRQISGLGDAREIIRWVYNDASMNAVSDVFELEDGYVIAVLTGKTEKGYATVDDVRDQLLPKVKNKMKGEIIKQRLNVIEGSLDEKAEKYGQDASVYSNSELKLTSNSLPSVGFAPEAVGTAFSLDESSISDPIDENDGIVLIQLNSLTPSPEIADYTTYKNQIVQRRSNQTSYLLSEAVKKFAEIKDERYKFF